MKHASSRQRWWEGLFLIIVILLAGCGSDGTVVQLPNVSGRVLDAAAQPVDNALVTVTSEPLQTTTDIEGRFSLAVEAGYHTMTITRDGMAPIVMCFTAVEGVPLDLGDITPATPANCNVAFPTLGDRDGDGLPDADETAGWIVTVFYADGKTSERLVTSSPDLYDSDADGLNDAEERAALLDPLRTDTDGDLLSDYGELYVYKSNPSRVDSDGDSCDPDSETCLSDANLWDGYELLLSKTSPTLGDTDGDGLDDYREIKVGGSNPRLADLPELRLRLHGDPSIILNITDLETNDKLMVQSTLERDTEKQVDTDTTSTRMSIENTVAIHTEAEAGTGTFPPSFNAKITTDTVFKHGYFHETSSSWTQESVNESQNQYQATIQGKVAVSYDDGMLWVAMKVSNDSALSFKLKDLKVIAYRMKANGSFSVVGTLTPGYKSTSDEGRDIWVTEPLCPNIEDPATCGYVLEPSGEITLVMGADSLPAQEMRALVANPTALMFEVGSYSLFQLDDRGVTETINYAKLGETVLERTGTLIIDYGNGMVERHMVATNVYRNADGSARGLSLQEALGEVIGRDYESRPAVDDDGNIGKSVLYRINDTAAYVSEMDPTRRGLWIMAGNSDRYDPEAAADFDDIILDNGNQISLVYVEDSDGDGLLNREENLLGIDRDDPDTDNDGLTDYEETKVGWDVAITGRESYRVYSDARFPDIDGDFVSDHSELYLGTDPYLPDSDGDGLDDAEDPDPATPPCLDGQALAITAWWDGSNYLSILDDEYYAYDIWVDEPDGVASDALVFGDDPLIAGNELVIDLSGNQVFRFNPYPDQHDQYLEAPHDDSLSPLREYTAMSWIRWLGVATGTDEGVVYAKGAPATYALSIAADGRLSVSIRRSVHKKCWFWFFGWVDNLCADSTYDETTTLTTTDPIPSGEWLHVTTTFGGETLRLYLNGENVAEMSTTGAWTSGSYSYLTTTRYLVGNSYPLRIGGEGNADSETLPVLPYRGLADDLQLSIRALNADEVMQVYNTGICTTSP